MTRQLSKPYLRVGLTGGIGSGKTTAAKRFFKLGAGVFHADEIARRALNPETECYNRVLATFGEDILNKDGTIDRKKLAQIVFSSDEKRSQLNEIIHPYVIETLYALADAALAGRENAIAIFDVPLLFESGMDADMDASIVVFGDEETRIRRIVERDGISREQAISRMRAQMPEEEKCLRADYLLDNNGSERALQEQVDALYQTLLLKDKQA